jgi:nicotinamidase-related amidase
MNDLFLFIDFQKIFEENEEWKVPGIRDCLNRAKKAHFLVSKVRNITTITTNYLPPADVDNDPNDYAWKRYFDQFASVPKHGHHELYGDLEYIPADSKWTSNGFSKWNHSLSYTTPFNVFITGVSTECCVLSTALSAVDTGANVYIISDACAAGTPEDHELGLRVLSKFAPNIQIIESKDIIQLFDK